MTIQERMAIQTGRPYKKIYEDPIDNYIASRQKLKEMEKEILRKQEEKQELENLKKELEKTECPG